MPIRSRVVLFTTLFSLVSIIFSSSIILAKYITIESHAEAQTFEKNKLFQNHARKQTELSYKEKKHLGELFEIENVKPTIFLTFDDGPTESTLEILRILESYQIHSTFFMLYDNILKHPDIVKSIVDNGHSIGCHGVSHTIEAFYHTERSPLEEMQACDQAIEQIAGEKIALVRVPFGSYPYLSNKQRSLLEGAGYILWDWNVDSNDWQMHSDEEIVQHVLSQVRRFKEKQQPPVLLFHDKEITAEALPQIIDQLVARGFHIKSIALEDEPVKFKSKE